MIVLDASAAVEIAVWPEEAPEISGAMAGQQVRAPAHFDKEVYAAVLRLQRRQEITAGQAALGLARTARLPAERVPLAQMLAEAYVMRDRFSPGDVFYAVLARRSSAVLVTCDASLARAAEDYVDVKLVARHA